MENHRITRSAEEQKMSIIILTECIEAERELYYTEHNVLPNNIGVHNTILNFTLSEKAPNITTTVDPR